jgi:Ala-tRNA(Pro) deacylase
MVGNGINNLIRRALPESERTEENILRVRAHFAPYYNTHNCDYTRPYEGIPELLATLKSQGHQLAVASNKYQAATEKIVNHFFPGIFDVILGEREGIERKPNPQIVYDILSTFNYKLDDFSQLSSLNSQLIYVGDSLVDRDTAANANVPFVACSWGFVSRDALIEAGVTRIIDQPQDLIHYMIEMENHEIISDRQERVLRYLDEHHIPFTIYNHPEGKTIEEAKRWWHDDGSIHCKNIFMRNHKGDQHYLICFPCDYDLAIHDIEHWLKDVLVSQGLKAPGKLSFASPERMMRYLGLEPGSVSPFGLINDTDHHVILFLDSRLKDAESLSFHPNDCRGTVVISQAAFRQFLSCVGNKVEYITTF